MWRASSFMKATQNRRISLSLLPLGSKSAPPLPPPIITARRSAAVFHRVRYAVRRQLTASKGILEDLLEAEELETAGNNVSQGFDPTVSPPRFTQGQGGCLHGEVD